MNKDEKNNETQASESQTPEEVTNEAETSEETESNQSSDVDHKAELEMARKELEKKDKRINQAEHVIEKLKAEGSQVNADTIEDMVQKMVDERVQGLEQKVRGDAIDSVISSYASNKDEAELIKFHLENSIKPSGDDITDIINAKALANKARFTQQSSEMKRAQSESEPEKVTSAGQKTESKKDMRLSEADRKIMRQYGITEEELRKGVR